MTENMPFKHWSNAAVEPISSKRQPSLENVPVEAKINQSTPTPYDVHTDGPLTYFNYYFEDVAPTVAAVHTESGTRSKLTTGLVGVGAVAVAVAAGCLIVDASKTETPVAKPTNTNFKQNSTTELPHPATAAPEQLSIQRSSPTVQPLKPRSSTQRSAEKSTILSPQSLSIAPISIATPEMIALNPPKISAQTPQASRRQLSSPSTSTNTNRLAAIVDRQSKTSPVSRASLVTRPELLSGNTTAPAANNPSLEQSPPIQAELPPNSETDSGVETASNPASILFQAEGFAPATATTPLPPSQTASDRWRTSEQPSAQLSVQSPEPRTEPEVGDRPAATIAATPQIKALSPEQNPTIAANAQRIQDYLTLPQTSAKALMPLSQQAAAEASNRTQLGQFTVRQVNTQNYQKEWIASNKTIADPAIALAFPAYGFIDYKRQLIVVLQPQSEKFSTQAQLTLPKS